MLLSLQIKNYVLVEHLELDFRSGMTVFTGETGAGKSIMIDALMLALGSRADSSVIRPNAQNCEVLAVFSLDPNSPVVEWLNANAWTSSNHDEVILRRVITSEGRSKCYLNDNIVTLQALKTCGEFLVHVHGQHEHQSLLKSQTHLEQLDRFAAHDGLLQDVKYCYSELIALKAKLKDLEAYSLASEKLDFLDHQLQEFDKITLDNYEILTEQHKNLQNAEDYLKIMTDVTDLINDNDDAILNQLYKTLQKLAILADNKEIQSSIGLFEQAKINIEEGLADLKCFAENISLDPEKLFEIEQQMTYLHSLARKHRVDIRELAQVKQRLIDERTEIETCADKITVARGDYKKLHADFLEKAQALSVSRQSYANKLATAITEIIQQLGMPHGYLQVNITQGDQPSVNGIDRVEYYICTNPGMPLSPLQKIASGGELSRISLAIEVVTAKQSQTPTLLFDEVDVGISGTTAAIVGKLLSELSQRLQIFCVTHQPQIAGFATAHYQVSKQLTEHSTVTTMDLLENESRVEELARMLGGLTINDQTRRHAKQLIMLEKKICQ